MVGAILECRVEMIITSFLGGSIAAILNICIILHYFT